MSATLWRQTRKCTSFFNDHCSLPWGPARNVRILKPKEFKIKRFLIYFSIKKTFNFAKLKYVLVFGFVFIGLRTCIRLCNAYTPLIMKRCVVRKVEDFLVTDESVQDTPSTLRPHINALTPDTAMFPPLTHAHPFTKLANLHRKVEVGLFFESGNIDNARLIA